MTDKRTQQQADQGNMQKDPDDWVTGDEPMTGAQRSYLKTLSEEAQEPFEETLTKAQASRRIDELQARTGRGAHGGGGQGDAGGGAGAQAGAGAPAPAEETPAESLGRAVGETVLGSAPPAPGGRSQDR